MTCKCVPEIRRQDGTCAFCETGRASKSASLPCCVQHGWFIFVGDSVKEYRLVYDYAIAQKEELEAGGFADVSIKRALVEVDA